MPDVSIVIVNYNVREFLAQCLTSLQAASRGLDVEIIIVDNHSTDGSVPFLKSRFPEITLIENDDNVGFGRANNQAFVRCHGKFIFLLNPDTLLGEETIAAMISFFEDHPDCGMAGCKVLNPDGSLQLACRRGFPTPLAAFGKFTGLSYLFPKSRTWGKYNLTFLDPDEINEVEAISGSCMMMRREALNDVRGFDEDFFLYGEDLDLCYRVREAGWKIYYYPGTSIIHHKGESARRSRVDIAREFYKAMHIFVEKHFHSSYSYYPLWLLKTGIWIQAVASLVFSRLRKIVLPAIDGAFIILAVLCAITIRFGGLIPLPVYHDVRSYLVVCGISVSVWLFFLASYGIYHRFYFSYKRIAGAAASGFIFISALTFFFNAYAFSRLAVLYAGILNVVILWGWRLVVKGFLSKKWASVIRPLFARRTAIWGTGQASRELAAQLLITRFESYDIVGFLTQPEDDPAMVPEDVRILGNTREIRNIVMDTAVSEVVFPPEVPHDIIFRAIMACDGIGVKFTLIPGRWEMLVGNTAGFPGRELPLLEMEYRYNLLHNKILKRGLDLMVSGCIFLFIGWMAYVSSKRKNLESRQIPVRSSAGKRLSISRYYIEKHPYAGWEDFVLRMKAVFSGDISLVGSPLTPVEGYDKPEDSMVKPGIWSPHQPRGYTSNFRLEHELFYAKNYSIILDLEIIARNTARHCRHMFGNVRKEEKQ